MGHPVKKNKSENSILDFVYEQEQQEIIWLGQQLLNLYNIEYDDTSRPRVLSRLFVKAELSMQKESYTSKVMHSYYERKIMDDTQVDKQLSNAWRKDKYLTSEVENYISVVTRLRTPYNIFEKQKREMVGKSQAVTINADYVLTTW